MKILKTTLTLTVLAALSLLQGRVAANHQEEVGEFSNVVITVGDTELESDGTVGQVDGAGLRLIDQDIQTGYSVPESLPDNQWVTFDWTHYSESTLINGVLFYTDETLMTGGTIKFYVDDVECPDTSGVGVNGVGGAFNCGLAGRVFTARCTETCTPNFSVTEVKLWKPKIVSLGGTVYHWDGNIDASGHENDASKVFGVGSYAGNPS